MDISYKTLGCLSSLHNKISSWTNSRKSSDINFEEGNGLNQKLSLTIVCTVNFGISHVFQQFAGDPIPTCKSPCRNTNLEIDYFKAWLTQRKFWNHMPKGATSNSNTRHGPYIVFAHVSSTISTRVLSYTFLDPYKTSSKLLCFQMVSWSLAINL